MDGSAVTNKKRIENHYLEEARRSSAIFPPSRIIPHERPDFLLQSDTGVVGIEVTELCQEEPRAEGGRLSKVPGKARDRYNLYPNSEPVDVSAAFSMRADTIPFSELTDSLADFVRNHLSDKDVAR
jgi:hypothetical protein